MGEGEKPTETGGGQGDRADRRLDSGARPVAAYLVIESGMSQLQRAGIDRFNMRRILDGLTAMTAVQPAPDALPDALQVYRATLQLGILALQSTDDLGPELNARLEQDHDELQRRLAELWARMGA